MLIPLFSRPSPTILIAAWIWWEPNWPQTALLLGVEVNPGAYNLEEELRRFEANVKAGAEFAITQPLFDVDLLVAFLARTREFAIPVIAGIWPLTSFRNAEFLVNELRVPIPEAYMDRMRDADSAEAAEAEGLAIAREIVERVASHSRRDPGEHSHGPVSDSNRCSARLNSRAYRLDRD